MKHESTWYYAPFHLEPVFKPMFLFLIAMFDCNNCELLHKCNVILLNGHFLITWFIGVFINIDDESN